MGEIVNIGNDGIVNVVFLAKMDEEKTDLYIKELKEIVNSSPTKLRILTDISATDHMDSVLRKKMVEGIKNLKHNIEKSAVIGFNSTFKMSIVQFVLTLSGRTDIKTFKSRENAIHWLKS